MCWLVLSRSCEFLELCISDDSEITEIIEGEPVSRMEIRTADVIFLGGEKVFLKKWLFRVASDENYALRYNQEIKNSPEKREK